MADTSNGPGIWEKRVTGKDGVFGYANKHSVSDAIKKNFKWEDGNKGRAFGKGATVAAGALITYDALARSQDSNGDDRSAMIRLLEGVLGIGTMAVGFAGGKVR